MDTNVKSHEATMLFAGGCFWCVESDMRKLAGVIDVVSGYAGGTTQYPTYENYAEGGHREVVLVTYDPSRISYRDVVIHALQHIDPTDGEGSFYDRGPGYSPAVYFETREEQITAEAVIDEFNRSGVYDTPLAVALLARPVFYPAEEYHQRYSEKNTAAYERYRMSSGRDAFIKAHESTSPTGEKLRVHMAPMTCDFRNFTKPSKETLEGMLTKEAYAITQEEGTEAPFNNAYWDNHEEGIYVDVISGEPLFSSTDKYDSGTGWPAFTKPIEKDVVTEHTDAKLFMERTEVRSKIADSHLGHVFNDGPKSAGGLRYCMNSASLRFIPKDELVKEGYAEFLKLFK